jgi:hypothetical protein
MATDFLIPIFSHIPYAIVFFRTLPLWVLHLWGTFLFVLSYSFSLRPVVFLSCSYSRCNTFDTSRLYRFQYTRPTFYLYYIIILHDYSTTLDISDLLSPSGECYNGYAL